MYIAILKASLRLCYILALLKRTKIEDINHEDITNFEYAVLEKENCWRVNLIQKISDVKCGNFQLRDSQLMNVKRFCSLPALPIGWSLMIMLLMDG